MRSYGAYIDFIKNKYDSYPPSPWYTQEQLRWLSDKIYRQINFGHFKPEDWVFVMEIRDGYKSQQEHKERLDKLTMKAKEIDVIRHE